MQRNMERKISKKQFFQMFMLLLVTGAVCILIYKAQIRENLQKPLEYTMMTEHKDRGEIVLSRETPEISEVFTCKVPALKKVSVECTGKNVAAGAMLSMTLSDEKTGEVYFEEKKSAGEILNSRIQKKVEMELKEPVKDSENKKLRLTWKLENGGSTAFHITANQKNVVVESFNEQKGAGTNVIYYLHYGDNTCLKSLYVLLCAALLLFEAMCFYMIVMRRMGVEKFFIPAALVLGMIFQCLFTVGSVPDEQTHFDTAYKFSNQMLFVEETENPYTIYKRVCDVEMSDMLTNGLESNSHYLLMTETFTEPERTELMEVPYLDASGLVPAVVYMPAAAGLSVGRLLGLSAMLTLQLGRVFNLIAFVLLAWAAIRIIPFGKNLLGMTALLPIALQQGASASYDAVVNGSFFVFIALCFRMGKEEKKKKWEIVLFGVFALFTAMTKGGVYLPLLLLSAFVFGRSSGKKNQQEKSRKISVKWFILAGVLAAALLVLCINKFMPVMQTFLQAGDMTADGSGMYTIPYLIRHPLQVVYLYWNTLMKRGDFLLYSFLGGALSWLDFEMSWLFVIVFLGGLILAANMEGDRFDGNTKEKVWIGTACVLSAGLIFMSMLVGYTKNNLNYIQGIQGRYFLPLAPAFLLLTGNKMIHVRKEQRVSIWMTVIVTEVLLVLQAAAMTGLV